MVIPHCESCTCYGPATKIKVIEVKQTCFACPSQWEGYTEDGRTIYVRFRHGFLSVRLSAEKSIDTSDAVEGPEVFGYNHPEEDGFLSYEELKSLTKHFAEWPEVSF